MSAQLVLMGPSGAGKTSLMLGLSRLKFNYDFVVDRTWTTQQRRPNEGDEEKIFTSREEFDEHRRNFLFTFSTFADYEYGIPQQQPIGSKEVRMCVLTPSLAVKFRDLIVSSVVLCSVLPYTFDLEAIIRTRDTNMNPHDIANRVGRLESDQQEAELIADIHFQNHEGLEEAAINLGSLVINYLDAHN